MKKDTQVFQQAADVPTTAFPIMNLPHILFHLILPGRMPRCNGLGTINQIDIAKIIPNPELSIKRGGIQPWAIPEYSYFLAT